MAMTLVSTVTVGSGGAASIEFTGIAGTGKDLLLLLSARATGAGSDYIGTIFLNNSSTNRSERFLSGNGTAASSGTRTTITTGVIAGTAWTANTFDNVQIYISNYAGSTAKSVSIDSVAENNGTDGRQIIAAGLWDNTAAVTSLKIDLSLYGGVNLAEFSTASLYIIS